MDKNILTFFVDFGQWDSKLLEFQVPRYLKSGLGRAGLGPWVGPWQCCAGAPAADPTQARFEISGNLEIQKFGISPTNMGAKYFQEFGPRFPA